jgi:Carboxypeptidase regulatory-like domain
MLATARWVCFRYNHSTPLAAQRPKNRFPAALAPAYNRYMAIQPIGALLRLSPAFLFCVLTAWAATLTPMTQLTVQVTTQAGRPLDRASVVVKFVQGRSVAKFGKKVRTEYELRTNQEGEAKVPEIPQGKILIQVIASGYQTFGQTFDVDQEAKTIEIKLNPPQAQYSAH